MTTHSSNNRDNGRSAQTGTSDGPVISGSVPASAEDLAEPASVSAAMTVLGEAVTELLNMDPAAVNDVGALEMLEQVARQRRRLEAVWLQAVAIADQLDATSAAGAPATLQQHLTGATGTSPGRAKADIEAARALHGEPTRELIRTATTKSGPLAPMGELLANGRISAAHIDTGVKTLEQIPERLSTPENLQTITAFLVNQAPNTTPKQIKTLANRLIRNLEPDTDDHYDPDAYNRRSFTINTDLTGMVHGSYQLDPAAGAELIAILTPLAAPHPGQKDEHGNTVVRDDRTPAQRRADAFGELIHAGATYLGPVNHAAPPSAKNDTGEPDTAGSSHNGAAHRPDGNPGTDANAKDPNADAEDLTGARRLRQRKATGQPAPPVTDLFGLDPVNSPTTGNDPQQGLAGTDHAQRPGTKPGQPPGTSPGDPSGSRAGKLRISRRQNRVSIVTTMDQIKTVQDRRTRRRSPIDPSDSYCEQTGPITSGTMARMSCDALFERVVLDAKGALLDLGLPVRLASPAQKRALAVRDGGCTAPGCNRPPSWCQVHHVLWYSHDGPTDIANLDLKCDTHHSAVHAGLLEVAMIDGIPYHRVTAKGAKTLGTTTPVGTVAHSEHSGWIRNTYFDQLKAADHAARAIIIPDATTSPQWAA